MKRTYMAVLAVLVWIGLLVQLAVTLRLSIANGLGVIGGIGRYFSYFTLLTNMIIAISLSVRLLRPRTRLAARLFHPVFETAVTLYIATVGVVYVLVLQDLWDPQGPQLIADIILHYVSPIMYAAYWLVFVPRGSLQWHNAIAWLSYPLLYIPYALLRGAFSGFYPYPFIDVAALGYPRVTANTAALLAAFLIAGLLLIAFDRVVGLLMLRAVRRRV